MLENDLDNHGRRCRRAPPTAFIGMNPMDGASGVWGVGNLIHPDHADHLIFAEYLAYSVPIVAQLLGVAYPAVECSQARPIPSSPHLHHDRALAATGDG